jgi:uncharacterized protein with NRDE domain
MVRNGGQILLTHNRDENIERPAPESPQWHTINGKSMWFPKDIKGGGTWMACSRNSFVCLLNGGFEKHTWRGPYKHSRGLVPLAALNYKNATTFYETYDFDNIEPFTLIIVQDENVHCIVWDGTQAHISQITENKAIWSSSTLYNAKIRDERKTVFELFMAQNSNPTDSQMVDFHHTAEVGNQEHNLIMKRENGIQTLSIFQFYINKPNVSMKYIDLQNKNEYFETFAQMA